MDRAEAAEEVSVQTMLKWCVHEMCHLTVLPLAVVLVSLAVVVGQKVSAKVLVSVVRLQAWVRVSVAQGERRVSMGHRLDRRAVGAYLL